MNTLHEESKYSSFVTRIVLSSVSDILLLAVTVDIFCEPVSVRPNNYYNSYLSKLLITNDHYMSSRYILRMLNVIILLFFTFKYLRRTGKQQRNDSQLCRREES